MSRRVRVALVNSADPRGLKVGGIETYIRDYIQYRPDDIDLLFIGPDEIGDLPPDQISRVRFRGRELDFLPIARLDDSVNRAPQSITQSETFRFAALMWRKRGLIGPLLRRGGYSVELRRVEYAPIFAALRVPFIQMLHVWGDRSKPMSGILGRHHRLRAATEYLAAALAVRFYTVNPEVTSMFARRYWPFGAKFHTLTTWANTDLFTPQPFAAVLPLRLVFAGRCDAFKRLDLMLRVVAMARQAAVPVEFHYVGDGDLSAHPEFSEVSEITVVHGRKSAADVAAILAGCHIGLLTSEFEGMPRFVLECLASGRPVVALHLPQLQPLYAMSAAGHLVPRGPDQLAQMAARIADLGAAIGAGRVDPVCVARAAAAHRPERLLAPIFDDHRRLAARRA
ncbi:glycosyltransferase [Phaeovulum veldkampii]|nr:glycosyltransferase [Phaeovulum veldkampii]TDQ62286.1 glycosyltransferase involved in cell wall biosynthesis [Phaeovulum veldkampii DSM 11550]